MGYLSVHMLVKSLSSNARQTMSASSSSRHLQKPIVQPKARDINLQIDGREFCSFRVFSPLSPQTMPPTPTLLTIRLLRHLLYRPLLSLHTKRSPNSLPPTFSKRILHIPQI